MRGIVVVAREGSSRLPRKHLYPLVGKASVLEVLLGRMNRVNAERKILAVAPGDRLYEEVGKALGWEVFRSGFIPEGNVLERVAKAAFGVIRVAIVNGDSPLMCPALVERMLASPGEIVISLDPPGFRAKVINTKALGEWYRWVEAQQEHILSGLVTPFPLGVEYVLPPLNATRPLTLDNLEQLTFLRRVVGKCGIEAFQEEIIKTANDLDNHPNDGAGGFTPDA